MRTSFLATVMFLLGNLMCSNAQNGSMGSLNYAVTEEVDNLIKNYVEADTTVKYYADLSFDLDSRSGRIRVFKKDELSEDYTPLMNRSNRCISSLCIPLWFFTDALFIAELQKPHLVKIGHGFRGLVIFYSFKTHPAFDMKITEYEVLN